MSEFEVRQARMAVEKSAGDFEQAMDQLLDQIEGGLERAKDFTSRLKDMKEPSEMVEDFIGDSLNRAKTSALGFLSDLRVAAEDEIRKIDTRPLIPLAGFLATGFYVGFILGNAKQRRNTRNYH